MSTEQKKIGRPTVYTEELSRRFCERIAHGESVRQICKDEDMPARSSVHEWLLDKRYKAFADQYRLACDIRAESMFDELLEIADDGTGDTVEREDGTEFTNQEVIARSRLRVDTRKWYLSKVLPKKFGDKLDLVSDGEVIRPTPIINVFRNNSDAKGFKLKKED